MRRNARSADISASSPYLQLQWTQKAQFTYQYEHYERQVGILSTLNFPLTGFGSSTRTKMVQIHVPLKI